MTDNHKADLDRVSTQNSYTDFTRTAEHLPQGTGFLTNLVNGTLRAVAQQSPYANTVSHSTDFGGTDLGLNQLLDLIEQTDPEDLESSGKALWDARDAIKSAAEELSGHIDHVHWVGESGDAFRKWGGTLVGKAHQLSDFAGGAGDQLTAAAVGLASVRSAMPARDTQANRKRPHEFTAAEKAADKEGYAAAVRVEKDRQEAINQMNRLASYYAVSNEQLTAVREKAPTFDAMPNVGVPKPQVTRRKDVPDPASGPTIQGTSPSAAPSHTLAASTLPGGGHDTVDGMVPAQHVMERTAPPDVPVATPTGTNIDSVGTLPPPVTTPLVPHTPPATGLPVSDGGSTNVFGGGLGAPLPNGIPGRGPGGPGGFRNPVSAQGRTGVSGPGAQNSERSLARGPMNQMGRATSAGQSIGRSATPTGAKPSTPSGRAVTGGTPRVGGSAASRATGGPTTGAGRANGVVGGRPTASPGGPAKGGGSRLPRGTVIGAEEATERSATGRPAARGVFGTPESTQRPGAGAAASASRGRAGGAGAEDISGRPAARNSAARAERNGMTRGGAGLVRGTDSHRQGDDGRKAERASRPDHVDDAENERHLPTQPRRDVPPVSN